MENDSEMVEILAEAIEAFNDKGHGEPIDSMITNDGLELSIGGETFLVTVREVQ